MPAQTALWCGCGRAQIFAQGRCPSCYFSLRYSQRYFGGLRDRVLLRDGSVCCGCGELNARKIIVHHRRPGIHQMRFLISLCRGCHVRIHRTWRPKYGFPDPLRALWREQYPRLAEQLDLQLALTGEVSSPQLAQIRLFDAA